MLIFEDINEDTFLIAEDAEQYLNFSDEGLVVRIPQVVGTIEAKSINFADIDKSNLYATGKIVDGINEYLDRHGFASVRDIIGALEI